jgi:hypothetical protein
MGEKRSSLHGSQEAMKAQQEGARDKVYFSRACPASSNPLSPTRHHLAQFHNLPIGHSDIESVDGLIH